MRDAAVGFHCPDCVAEGRRTTRQARTPYGGLRPGSFGLVSKILIALNAAVWVLILSTGGNSSVWVDRLSIRPKGACVLGNRGFDVSSSRCASNHGTWLPGVSDGAWWQPVTSMFTHVAVWHIGFNMLVLWVLGPQLELAVGRLRYLAIYFISGLAGSAAVMWLAAPLGLTLGASGAIFGLMGALLVIALKVHGDVRGIATWIVINLVLTFTLGGISWQGHLGGLAGGILTGAVVVYAPREHRVAWQSAGLAAVAAAVLLATATRVAVL
jgi:membrane associated rhomboid family serine protease